MEGTLKIARHQKLQMRSNAMDTMLILSRYKGNLPVPIVQFHFNISQTAVDHPPLPAPLAPFILNIYFTIKFRNPAQIN